MIKAILILTLCLGSALMTIVIFGLCLYEEDKDD